MFTYACHVFIGGSETALRPTMRADNSSESLLAPQPRRRHWDASVRTLGSLFGGQLESAPISLSECCASGTLRHGRGSKTLLLSTTRANHEWD